MKPDYCAYPPRVADDVDVTADRDGDRLAYIVGSAARGRYLLLRATEHNVLGLLHQSLTPGEVCEEFKRQYGATLSLPTLQKFLAKLDDASILAGQCAQRPEAWGQLSGSPYFRINLFNPDRLFTWMVSALRWVWTKEFFIFSLALMFVACGLALLNGTELVGDSIQALREHYVAILMAGLFVGLSHEFAHGLTSKAFGGRATEVGVLMIYYFLPALYCNVSGIHLIRQRSQRLWVIAAGIYWQLLVGTAALFLWLVFAPHTLVSNVALIFLLGSVLDVFINVNPLIKLDGYYFLSQWLRLPNLMDRSRAYWRGLLRRILFGETSETEPPHSRRERVFYALFGLLSSLYIVALLGAIVLFVGGYLLDSFYLLGSLLTAGITLWYLRRPLKQIASAGASLSVQAYLRIRGSRSKEAHSSTEHGASRRGFLSLIPSAATGISTCRRVLKRRYLVPAALLLLFIGFLLIPWSASVGNYGTLGLIPGEEAIIRAPENATLVELRVRPGDTLASGAAVGRMISVELEDQTAEVQSDLARAKAEAKRVQGELRAHDEAVARADVQCRQRQYDYNELTAEQEQIQMKHAGALSIPAGLPPVFDRDQSILSHPLGAGESLAMSSESTAVFISRETDERASFSQWERAGNARNEPGSKVLALRPGRKDLGLTTKSQRAATNYPASIAVLEAEVDLRQAQLAEATSQLERAGQLSTLNILARQEMETAETRSATLTIETSAARQRLEAALIDHRRKHTRAATDMLLARSALKTEQVQVEKLHGEMRAMQVVIETLDQRLDLLQRRRAQFELVTPRAGVVFGEELPRQVEQYFSKGAEICRVAETRQLLVRIQVPETEIGDVRVGHPVRLKARALPDQLFRGVVSKIGSESEPDEHRRMTYRVELTVENQAGLLRPGMTAFTRIDFDRQAIGRILLHKLKQTLRPELWML